MDLQLENKVVLVTGGAKGIGAAIVRAAAAEAAIPVIVDRDADAGRQLHAEAPTSHVIIADLSSPANCQTAIDSTVYGGVLGGIINVVSKSGTNNFHGAAWEFFRNTVLDAENPLAGIASKLENQFGANFGGPVILPHYNGRNKTFFFVSYEGFCRAQPATGASASIAGQPSGAFYNVPTPAELAGDFSALLRGPNPIQLYNPFTTRPDPANPGSFIRDPFPNNNISSVLNPGAVSLAQAIFPAPPIRTCLSMPPSASSEPRRLGGSLEVSALGLGCLSMAGVYNPPRDIPPERFSAFAQRSSIAISPSKSPSAHGVVKPVLCEKRLPFPGCGIDLDIPGCDFEIGAGDAIHSQRADCAGQ